MSTEYQNYVRMMLSHTDCHELDYTLANIAFYLPCCTEIKNSRQSQILIIALNFSIHLCVLR